MSSHSFSLSLFKISQVHELIFFASHFIISLTDGVITHILARIRMQDCHFPGIVPFSCRLQSMAHTCVIEKTPFLHSKCLGFFPSFLPFSSYPSPLLLFLFSFLFSSFIPPFLHPSLPPFLFPSSASPLILRENSAAGFSSSPTFPRRKRFYYFIVF